MNYEGDVARYHRDYYNWSLQVISITTQAAMQIRKRKLLGALACCLHDEEKKKQRTCWVSPLCKLRDFVGFHAAIYPTIRNMDREFVNYFRMPVSKFDELLAIIGPEITKKQTPFRQPISPTERLSLTLRYLATGDLIVSFHYSYLLGLSTIDKIIKETSSVIWNKLCPLVLPSAIREEEWLRIAEEFEKLWHFPHAIAALDGKHVRIQKPVNAGSEWFNYKSYHSLVLMAACSATYRFLFVDIGAFGRRSDGGIFTECKMGQLFRNNKMNVPNARAVSANSGTVLPYVILADEAFPLEEWLMRPFPRAVLTDYERVYNYRLSRGRRTIENAFGILVSRWRIFRCPMTTYLETAEELVKACVCLHNWLLADDDAVNDASVRYVPPGLADVAHEDGSIVEGSWRSDGFGSLSDIGRVGRNNFSRNASFIRNEFRDYFNGEGKLLWQYDYI